MADTSKIPPSDVSPETKEQPPQDPSVLRRDQKPDNLGHEGAQSTIKPNTTDQGQRSDRGP